MPKTTKAGKVTLAYAQLVALGDSDQPALHVADLLVCPDGKVDLADGTSIKMDATVAGSIVKEFNKRAVHVPIDFDHQTLYGPQKGQPAPACGWIKHRPDGTGLKYVPGTGLVASEVDWGSAAADAVHNKSYRYSSPVLIYRKSGETWLHSLALTNKPLTLGATELLAASERVAREFGIMAEQPEGAPSDGSDILILLGQLIEQFELKLEPGAPPVAVLQAVLEKAKGVKADADGESADSDAVASMRKLFELDDDVEPGKVVAAAEQMKVAKAATGDVKVMAERLQVLEAKNRTIEIAAALHKWQTSDPPRINVNNTEHIASLKAMAEREYDATGALAEFDKFMSTSTPVMPASGPLPMADGGGTRESIIAASAAAFDLDGEANRKLTSKEHWINLSLNEAGQRGLTAKEGDELGIANPDQMPRAR